MTMVQLGLEKHFFPSRGKQFILMVSYLKDQEKEFAMILKVEICTGLQV